ncbi:MAG: HAD family hydrolase [Lachnospiraceae bacterium]|nr:HAD family hydrolase [Lachnospiraceae bacterium]
MENTSIKAMFFDLDGTLLNSERKIPLSAVKALNECKIKGIKLFIATARPVSLFNTLEISKEEKDLFDGGLFCNGAVISVNSSQECYFIPNEAVKKAVEVMKAFKTIRITLQKANNEHISNIPFSKEDHKIWGTDETKTFSIDGRYNDIVKILISDGDFVNYLNPLPTDLINTISIECGKLAKVYITDNGCIVQIVNEHISKYAGIERIRNKLKLSKDEIAVFGDDFNDIEMLSNYKNSVAMANGSEEVKRFAGFVTKSNDDDGIAYGIKHILS